MSLILVVDDDSSARRAMEELLVDEGYDVVSTHSVSQAVEHLRARRPCLLVTALAQPDHDRARLFEHARRHHPPVPIVLITSCLRVDARRAIERLGVAGFVNTPIEVDELLGCIDAAVGPRRSNASPGPVGGVRQSALEPPAA